MKSSFKTIDLVYVALFAALMAVCAWISIPTTVPFTLQTFGVFIAVGVLGGKLGSLAVFVYVLMGAIGIPVFAGFTGGLGALVGSTGGYIIGFVLSALTIWLFEKLFGAAYREKALIRILAMAAGLLVCYFFGTIWFMIVYGQANGAVGLTTVLGWCVIPFIIPDVAKIGLAYVLAPRLKQLMWRTRTA